MSCGSIRSRHSTTTAAKSPMSLPLRPAMLRPAMLRRATTPHPAVAVDDGSGDESHRPRSTTEADTVLSSDSGVGRRRGRRLKSFCRCGRTTTVRSASPGASTPTRGWSCRQHSTKRATGSSSAATSVPGSPRRWSKWPKRSLDSVADRARRSRFRVNLFINTDRDERALADAAGWNVPDAIRRYLTCNGTVTPVFLRGRPARIGRARPVRRTSPDPHGDRAPRSWRVSGSWL